MTAQRHSRRATGWEYRTLIECLPQSLAGMPIHRGGRHVHRDAQQSKLQHCFRPKTEVLIVDDEVQRWNWDSVELGLHGRAARTTDTRVATFARRLCYLL